MPAVGSVSCTLPCVLAISEAIHRAAHRLALITGLMTLAMAGVMVVGAQAARAACANPVACENQLTGDPESDWQPTTPDFRSNAICMQTFPYRWRWVSK